MWVAVQCDQLFCGISGSASLNPVSVLHQVLDKWYVVVRYVIELMLAAGILAL